MGAEADDDVVEGVVDVGMWEKLLWWIKRKSDQLDRLMENLWRKMKLRML